MDTAVIERVNQLLERIRTEKAGQDDYAELLRIMDAYPQSWLAEHIQDYFSLHPKNVPGFIPDSRSVDWQQVLENVLSSDRPANRENRAVTRNIRSRRLAVAAASVALLIVAAGLLWFLEPGTGLPGKTAHSPAALLPPGREGAILTLGDGSTITLDSLGNGLIASQAGSRAILKNGQLAYEPAATGAAAVSWNTITIPKARQFRVSLPDGTKVWLNAATSLRFPTSFKGKERIVELAGEAYFEVAQNASQPFRVRVGDTASVEVLGTSFNVNAYTDEPGVRATLLEGRIRVNKRREAILLHPGQQAVIQSGIVIDEHANIEGSIAWKNGKFNFEGASLEEFMRQISRWYDIEVVYKGHTPQMLIRGKPGRDLQLQDLLDALSGFGIRYQLDGRKLTIY